MIVKESLLKPKSEKEVFDDIFGDQYFFRNKYNKEFTLTLDTGGAIKGHIKTHITKFLKLDFYDTASGKTMAEMTGKLLDFIKYFLSLKWSIPEIVTYLKEQYQAKKLSVNESVNESIDDLFKPKSGEEIIKNIFKDTRLENADPNDVYYLKIDTWLGYIGEKFILHDINYKKTKNNDFIIWAPIKNLIEYYFNINWNKNEIIEYLEKNAIKEENFKRIFPEKNLNK